MQKMQPERVIETDWGGQSEGVFAVDIVVDANDRQGLLRDISEVLTREKINVIAVNTQSKQGKAHMKFTAEINRQLKNTNAVKNNRIILIDENIMFRPGPRVIKAAYLLRNKFADVHK